MNNDITEDLHKIFRLPGAANAGAPITDMVVPRTEEGLIRADTTVIRAGSSIYRISGVGDIG